MRLFFPWDFYSCLLLCLCCWCGCCVLVFCVVVYYVVCVFLASFRYFIMFLISKMMSSVAGIMISSVKPIGVLTK